MKAQWAQTGPGIPKTSKNPEFELHVGLSLDAQIDETATEFQTPLGGGPQSAVRCLRASILRAFEYLFGDLFEGEWKNENCAHVRARAHLRGFDEGQICDHFAHSSPHLSSKPL